MSQTFVIRIFGGDDAPGGLRGVARHVASGRERPFGGLADLAAFLEAGVAQPEADVGPVAGGHLDGTG